MDSPCEGWRQNGQFEASLASSSGTNILTTGGQSHGSTTPAIAYSSRPLPFATVTQGVVTAATGAGLTIVLRRAFTGSTMSGPGLMQGTDSATVTAPVPVVVTPPPQPDGKPAHDVVAGAVARAASQSTIHPLDTMKVRMQAGNINSSKVKVMKVKGPKAPSAVRLERSLVEFRGLYKGVIGAATGAGIIIGTYFAFYSTTKRFLREKTELHEGASAFVAGATAALGSSVVKVPLAVCIRSVQAGIYKNVFHAAKSIVKAAGYRGLFTGFVPTILEDVPDMAVKFAVYETLRKMHVNMRDGRPANIVEDLLMGGVAGAAAAAATTPLDVLKTVMMCSASSRPTLAGAARSIMREGNGMKPFFRGVGPRALSNGLNSAIFFCFFEAIRQVLIKKQERAAALATIAARSSSVVDKELARQTLTRLSEEADQKKKKKPTVVGAVENKKQKQQQQQQQLMRPAGTAAACLSLALPAAVGDWKNNA